MVVFLEAGAQVLVEELEGFVEVLHAEVEDALVQLRVILEVQETRVASELARWKKVIADSKIPQQ